MCGKKIFRAEGGLEMVESMWRYKNEKCYEINKKLRVSHIQ